jgi:hypothetical protein
MKRLLRKLQAALTAAAFAEEGDADTARHIVAEAEQDGGRSTPPGREASGQRSAPRAVPLPVTRRARGA